LLLVFFSCDKEENCYLRGESKLPYQQFVEKIYELILDNKMACVYNMLNESTRKKYDLYTFSLFAQTFSVKRLVFNLKYHKRAIECVKYKTDKIICNNFIKNVTIPIFLEVEQRRYIDENTGAIRKEKKLALEIDFDFYSALLNEIKRKYNTDLFYDYVRSRGE
jgi:hypothetical protein